MTDWPANSIAPREASLEVYLLGLVDFDASLFLQEQLVAEINQRNDGHGALLLCEHPPLLTIGREGSRAHILCEQSDLVAREMEVRWLNRGGGCIVHAPGQLALYPIIPLRRRGHGLCDYRDLLAATLLDLCREMRVPAHRRDQEPGVWCRGGQVAHLGIAVRDWVSYHGAFVNISPNMDSLRLVRSVTGGRMSSLSAECLRPITMHAARESLIRNFAARLGYERYHLYTGHPLLRRTKRVCVYA